MKKIFFDFNWDATYLFHKMAVEIKKRNAETEFLGTVTGHDYLKFLLRQDEIAYLATPLSGDVALKYLGRGIDEGKLLELEGRYGNPNLLLYAYGDRDLAYYSSRYDHQEIKEFLFAFFEFYDSLFKEHEPSAVVGWAPADLNRLAMYAVAKRREIPVHILCSTRIPGRIVITDNINDRWPRACDLYEQFKKTGLNEKRRMEAEKFLREFRMLGFKPDYTSELGKAPGIKYQKSLKTFKYIYEYYFTGEIRRDYTRPGPAKRILQEIAPFFRHGALRASGLFEKPGSGEEYAYFPLHVEPEASTMVLAPFHVDQIPLLWNISKSLPVNMKLYVKEHVPMLGKRPLSYYRKIKKIPNVRLIDPFCDSHELIKRAGIIITITGTVGWEGLLYGKPVISFGNAFYNASGLVKNIPDVTMLPGAVKEMLEGYELDMEMLYAFIAAIFESTYPGKLSEPLLDPGAILSGENVKLLTNALLEEMNRGKAAETAK